MDKIASTVNMYIIAEMIREEETASFDYYDPFIENNKIKILPKDNRTYFSDAYLWHEFVDKDNIEDLKRICGINLSANIELVDTENDNFNISANDFGELVISFEANSDEELGNVTIAGVMLNSGADLVNENMHEEPETAVDDLEADNTAEVEPEDNKPDTSNIEAEVLTEDENPEEGPAWVVTYSLDTMRESLNEEEEVDPQHQAVIHAPDIETAAKYAEQQARMNSREHSSWSNAEVVSIKKKDV